MGNKVSLRHNTAFQRLVAATVSNEFSSAMSLVALPLFTLTVTGSPTQMGVASAVFLACKVILQALSGAVIDRFSASLTLRVSSLLQACAWGSLGVCAAFNHVNLAVIIAAAVVAGSASSLDGPSEYSLIKEFVPRSQLGAAAAVGQARESGAEVLGGPTGSALLAMASTLVFGVQTILHVLATFLVPGSQRTADTQRGTVLAQTNEPGDATNQHNEPEPFFASVVKGFHLVMKHPGLRGITLVASIANLPMAAVPVIMIAAFEEGGVAAWKIGFFAGAFALGVILGSPLASRLSSSIPLGILGAAALGVYAAGLLVLAFSSEFFVFSCIVFGISGIPLPAFNSAIGAYMMAVTPDNLVGRVVSATGAPGMVLMPLGILLAGVGFDLIGVRWSVLLCAVIAVTTCALMVIRPALRTIPRLRDLEENVG